MAIVNRIALDLAKDFIPQQVRENIPDKAKKEYESVVKRLNDGLKP